MKTLEQLFKEHQEFSIKKFPNSTWESSLRGLEREIEEVESAKMDYYIIDGQENRKKLGVEYIDCIMYILDSMKRAGFSSEEIPELFEYKLNINIDRDWKQNKDGSYSHV